MYTELMDISKVEWIAYFISLAIFTIVFGMHFIKCGELKDLKTKEITELSCFDRLAIWLDRKDYL